MTTTTTAARSGRRKWKRGGLNVGWFYDEVYGVNVHLIWPADGPKLRRYLEAQTGDDYSDIDDEWKARCVSQSFKEGELHVIALRRFTGSAADISMLVHECVHAAAFTLDTRGVKLALEHDEPYAYYIDMLVRRCLELLRRKK